MAVEKVLVTPAEPVFQKIWRAFAVFVPDGGLSSETFPTSLISGTDELWLTLHAPRHPVAQEDARLLLADPPSHIGWWTDVIIPAWNPEPGIIVMKALAEYLDGSLHDRA
ncbi:MAG: hypothetical protein Q4D96_02585 [Propionibacteriaceae bacterium]|nr:hypothetical protein [Propionibacteriaceae bacterium]